MSANSPRNPMVRPVPRQLFARELARFWPRLLHPETVLSQEAAQLDDTHRFQVDLLAMDEQHHIVLLDAKWELPARRHR